MNKSCRNLIFILILVLFAAPLARAEQETEVSLSETLQTFAPPPTFASLDDQTITDNGTDDPISEEVPLQGVEMATADGSVEIVVTAVGDLTIGGDVRKSGLSIFEKENEKQGGDPSFVMRNVKELFSEDHLTLANFEGTLTTAPIPGNKKGNSFLFLRLPNMSRYWKREASSLYPLKTTMSWTTAKKVSGRPRRSSMKPVLSGAAKTMWGYLKLAALPSECSLTRHSTAGIPICLIKCPGKSSRQKPNMTS